MAQIKTVQGKAGFFEGFAMVLPSDSRALQFLPKVLQNSSKQGRARLGRVLTRFCQVFQLPCKLCRRPCEIAQSKAWQGLARFCQGFTK
jgi:hypothetical protein